MVTAVTSISQNIPMEIDEIDELLNDAKKQDAKNTTKKLEDLLIEYIIANMKGDSKGAKDISNEISSLITKYSGDIEKANALEDKLKTVANNPNEQTAAESAYLQGLIAALKNDAISGEMNGF